MTNKFYSFVEIFLDLILILLTFFIVLNFIFSPFVVNGISMCNSLNYVEEICDESASEIVIVNSLTYMFDSPLNYDIIVFKTYDGNKNLVKRIFASQFDKVKIYDNQLYVNDFRVDYLNNFKSDFDFEFVVPEDSYFVLGDNYGRSQDSLNCFSLISDCTPEHPYFFIHKNQIKGRVDLVVFPFSEFEVL